MTARELPVEERKRMEQFEAARQAALAREDAPELESQLRAECESRGLPVDLAGLLRHVEAAAKLAGAFDGLAAREERPKAWMVTRVRSILERDDIPSNVAERLAHSIVAAFAPEVEELPGDGQRPDHLEAAISEVMRRTPRGAVFTRTQAEWIALGVLAAKKVVRDTEREHEPAKAEHELLDAAVAAAGYENTPVYVDPHGAVAYRAGWRDSRARSDLDAQVLAKALDQFFRDADELRWEHEPDELVGQLWERTRPTLQALGYPKEAGV